MTSDINYTFEIMRPPAGKKYLEVTAYITWMGDDGICRTTVKPGSAITIAEAKENSIAVQSFDNGEVKYPLVVDARGILSMTKEARDYLSLNNRTSPVNAIAIVVDSPLSRIIGNFFIGLN